MNENGMDRCIVAIFDYRYKALIRYLKESFRDNLRVYITLFYLVSNYALNV